MLWSSATWSIAPLLLILTLSLTGLVYLYLYADFLALVQILIYGGTVSVLLLFALMLTRPGAVSRPRPIRSGPWQSSRPLWCLSSWRTRH